MQFHNHKGDALRRFGKRHDANYVNPLRVATIFV